MNLTCLSDKADSFVIKSGMNKVEDIGLRQIFDRPLLAISSADDFLYDELKKEEVVGEHHMSPREWLSGAKSVISYFLPFSREVRNANFGEGLPDIKWVYGRIEGEHLNNELRSFISGMLVENGAESLVPVFDKRFKIVDMRANWSERHVAFISGLGTFGLSKSMITRQGSAGRFGSVLTDMDFAPTKREYTDVYEWCCNCGQCINRCPPGAITSEGKDHIVCGGYLRDVTAVKFAPRYGCGKCQTAVMCEGCAPVK